MNSKRGSRRRAAGACLAAAALAPLLSPAHAAGSTWTFGGSGNWSLASNWIGGVPVAGSDAWVARGDAINRTINYDYGGPSIQLNAVTIVNNGTGSMVFSQAANTLNATSEAIGVLNGRGYWQLSGGTHNVNVLTFGDTSSSRGIGTLSGGTLSVTSNFSLTAGTFTQTGGSANVAGNFSVGSANFVQSAGTLNAGTETVGLFAFGFGVGGFGTVSLSGGVHHVANDLNVAAGSFNVNNTAVVNADTNLRAVLLGTITQTGGTVNVGTGPNPGSLQVGTFVGTGTLAGSGTYQLSAGALNVSDELVVAYSSTGTFAQSGGTVTLGSVIRSANLRIGTGTMLGGTYSLGPGALNVTGEEFIGSSAAGSTSAGTFLQTGGTHQLTGTLNIGGSGTYLLSSGGLFNASCININSGGVLDAEPATLNAGSINVNAGGTFIASAAINAATHVTRGTFVVPGNGATYTGSLSFDPTENVEGPTARGIIDGQLNMNGTLSLDNSVITGTGQLVTSVTLRGTGKVSVTNVINGGTITSDGGALAFYGSQLSSFGTVKNAPNSSLFIRTGTFNNQGNVTVNAGGGITSDPDLRNAAGKTLSLLGGVLATPSVTNVSGGTVSGFGQITGNFINNGRAIFNGPTQIVGDFNNTGTVSVRNAQTLITGIGNNTGTITTSNGTIVFDGGVASSPVSLGTMSADPGAHVISSYLRQGTLTIGGVSGSPGMVNLRTRADGGDTSVLRSLTIAGSPDAWAGVIDLADTAAVIDFDPAGGSPVATIQNLLKSGYAHGAWTGNGITSSNAAGAAAAASPHRTALGYVDNAALNRTTFRGQPTDASSVLIGYAYAGDGDLSGTVDLTDFTFLAANFNKRGGASWLQGDYNYDGNVDLTDFTFLASNFNQSLPSGDGGSLGAPVPEPVSWALSTVLAAAGALHRRRRRGFVR